MEAMNERMHWVASNDIFASTCTADRSVVRVYATDNTIHTHSCAIPMMKSHTESLSVFKLFTPFRKAGAILTRIIRLVNMLPKSVQNLIDELSKLPGVGPKTAARLCFYMLSKPNEDIQNIGRAFTGLKENLHYCRECYNIAESEV